MDEQAQLFERLRQILRQIRDPQSLDDHPWTRSLIVREALEADPALRKACPGQQLIAAIVRLFSELQPPAPPRRGKRLDPRWGEFGLLAALYFTPFNHGTPYPNTLMDAWGRIDPAILYFVYGRNAAELQAAEIERYRLVGNDLEFGSASTLSDWHRKGLQRFTDVLLDRERYLARNRGEASVILEPEQASVPPRNRPRLKRWLWASLLLVFVALLALGAARGWRIYQAGRVVYQDAGELRGLLRGPIGMETARSMLPGLVRLREDLSLFEVEAQPVLWLCPRLGWVPDYGFDLVSAPALLEMAGHMLDASILSLEAAGPLLDEVASETAALDTAGLTRELVLAQPKLEQARGRLDQALALREGLDVARLSPRLQGLMTAEIDRLLGLADDGLSLAAALPGVLGAGSEGPKTYLLLVQNEDELRPTGGFITTVGNLVVHQGRVISLEFEPVDNEQEDWSKPYPAAPWQLQEYMNSPVLILRDSNWFSDFPTSALWAEYLYAYKHDHSVDGVIAFDQQFLVMLLGEIGPLEVEGAPYPLTDGNVIEYMRQAKVPPTGEARSPDWYRKEFIRQIADAMLAELDHGGVRDWKGMAQVLSRALEERHLLLQFDDADVGALLAERGWDTAVRPGQEGDYLLVTDTNIGFNKTSAVVDVGLTYDVDLTDLSAPEATLTLIHANRASRDVPCIQWGGGDLDPDEKWYPINRCYWTYTRVYKQAGVELLDATPHAIPGDRMLLGRGVPARVDELEEDLAEAEGFGTLLVVAGGETLSTSFQFALPETIIITHPETGLLSYRLHVQKQPGTLAHPLLIRVHLPSQADLESLPPGAVVQKGNLLVEMTLQTDVELEIVFSLP